MTPLYPNQTETLPKYGCDVAGGTIGITAARSPVFAWHDPEVLD
jgi:hypothetical protein